MNTDPVQIANDLTQRVRGDVFADVIHRAAFSTDASIYRIVPQCVVAPRDASDVVKVVEYAATNDVPVAPRGAGSGLAGESLCSGIVLDMSRYMRRILRIDDDGRFALCEPGVVLDVLNEHLRPYGRKIGPDPSSANRATVGGCVANNATGAHSLQYGHIGDYVESVEVVLADGTIAQLSNHCNPASLEHDRAASIARQLLSLLADNQKVIGDAQPSTKRDRCGYNIADVCGEETIDLAKLLAGSEGTLAIFTKIRLRTVELPAAKGLLQLEFDSLHKMAQSVPTIVEAGATACELMDQSLINMAIDALPHYRDLLPADAAALLLVEHVGESEQQVRGKIERTDQAVGKLASGRSIVLDAQSQARVWKSRKDAGPLLYRKRRRQHPAEFMEDVCVDCRQLGAYIEGVQKIVTKHGTSISYWGHAGDGELHLRPYLDLGDPDDVKKMQDIAEEVFALAWSLGGSISGEHADGLIRAGHIRRQFGDEYYEILRHVKNAFDPRNVLNPGKILNDDPDVMVTNLRRVCRVRPDRAKSDLLFADQEHELELEQCYGCGLCLNRDPALRMCPVFRATGDELGSSRAKANLLNFWATGQLGDADFESPEFRKFLDLCVNCKMCEQQCPSGVNVSLLIAAARAEQVKRKGLRRPEAVLSANRYFSALSTAIAPLSNLMMKLPIAKALLEKVAGLDKRRAMPTFQRGRFLLAARKYLSASEPISDPADAAAYFVDTYAAHNDHELGFAVIDVLRHNDVDVVVPPQRPAPLPAIVYGNVGRARKDLSYIARQFADAVRAGRTVICSEPSAALCLREEMRCYIDGDDVKLLASNTVELMNYLSDLARQGRLKPAVAKVKEPFLYHLPCHLCSVGEEDVSIRLLREHFDVNVVDLQAGCCGLSGTYGMQRKNYELSANIAEPLKQALQDAAANNVLTECAACKMQIEHLGPYNVFHPAKIIARCYGLLQAPPTCR